VPSESLTFRKVFKSHSQFFFNTERFDRGQWVPGELMRKVVDFCEAFHNPAEAWSVLAKYYKDLRCPIKAGVSDWWWC
jgi:hypothetical protein